jgi:thymidylate kinase
VARRLLPQLRHARFAHQGHPENHRSSHVQEKTEERPSLLYAGRAVALAWDRYRLLIKVKRWVAGGEIVICDRYPSGSIGAMDSPRLKEHPGHSGVKAALYDWLAGVERRLYDKIPPPDIALRLSVSIETAKQRNRERLKSDKHSEDYLETLYQQNHEWNRDGTKSIYDVSTENSIAETILRVKRAIWESL